MKVGTFTIITMCNIFTTMTMYMCNDTMTMCMSMINTNNSKKLNRFSNCSIN
ncbi:hypothetical protein ACFIJ5_10100 [Haloimpatiens sp. FM7330]|uniref:hypothetical protein n=1 Tax=Haloimpatiens sp. FM7330 TaxID=3298610 RepID=UPI00363E9712